jgi:hypothetical protein
MQDPFVDSSCLKIFDANEKIYLDFPFFSWNELSHFWAKNGRIQCIDYSLNA